MQTSELKYLKVSNITWRQAHLYSFFSHKIDLNKEPWTKLNLSAFGRSCTRSPRSCKVVLPVIKGRELDKKGQQKPLGTQNNPDVSLIAAWDKITHSSDRCEHGMRAVALPFNQGGSIVVARSSFSCVQRRAEKPKCWLRIILDCFAAEQGAWVPCFKTSKLCLLSRRAPLEPANEGSETTSVGRPRVTRAGCSWLFWILHLGNKQRECSGSGSGLTELLPVGTRQAWSQEPPFRAVLWQVARNGMHVLKSKQSAQARETIKAILTANWYWINITKRRREGSWLQTELRR